MPVPVLTYPGVLGTIGNPPSGRTESRAFLSWVMQNYFRLEASDADDAICDGPDDKGIDAILIDDSIERITLLQSKLFQNNDKFMGDNSLKLFVASMDQFVDPAYIKDMAETTYNHELRGIITQGAIADKVAQGYEIRGAMATNAELSGDALMYLKTRPDVVVYDRNRLNSEFIPSGPSGPRAHSATFDLSGYGSLVHTVQEVKVYFAPISSLDLVQLDGIASGELFEWNVRQSLSKTKVNKEIAASIKDVSEHSNFLMYHNGLTILAESVDRASDDTMTIKDYTVVNGCQSLTTLFDNKTNLSSDLRILTRIIEISPNSKLAEKITHHTNNQNSTVARDFQSNSPIQRRLQTEIAQSYPDMFYRIKRGETIPPHSVVLENELAARILLAFDLREPWSAHQTYRLLDDLHARIFGRQSVNAHRIISFHEVYNAVIGKMNLIDNKLFAGYTLSKFFFLYLVREDISSDELGLEFVSDPTPFIQEMNGRVRIRYCVQKIMDELVDDVNYYFKNREEDGNSVDYKRELKSPNPLKELARQVVPQYTRLVKRGKTNSFADDWKEFAVGEVLNFS